MNFFAWQDAARKRTRLLIALMGLAILALTLGLNLLVGLIMLSTTSTGLGQLIGQPSLLLDTLTWPFFGGSFLFILLLVVGGSYYRLRSLSGGGHTVAQQLGGQYVNPGECSALERRLLNVVEEMAIASGTPVPSVYLLKEESGINAFAAGSQIDNAVIGVTQGCIEQLSRDELEGVIAHEFSHIVHGDMRLNLRLMGVIFGITMLTEIGSILLRSSGRRSYRRSYSSNRKSSGGALVAVGAGLCLLGWTGTFFGNWIRASVSRTREFLADASAVQYSRSPDGIADALKRIGGCHRGTTLTTPRASEASHMLFAAGLKGGLQKLFATHPPLTDRIEKLEPQWDGEFFAPALQTEATAQADSGNAPVTAKADSLISNFTGKAGLQAQPAGAHLSDAITQMGQPQAEHFAYARALLDQLPEPVQRACREPKRAYRVLLALMIHPQTAVRTSQRHLLEQAYDAASATEVMQLAEQINAAKLPDKLALLELTLPHVRHLSLAERDTFSKALSALARADQRVSLFEWALIAIVRHQLNSLACNVILARDHCLRPRAIAGELQLILATFCRVSKMPPEGQQRCYSQALKQMGLDNAAMEVSPKFNAIIQALDKARQLYPLDKEALLETCCTCIRFDGEINLSEAQTLRTVALLLECPVPPLVGKAKAA